MPANLADLIALQRGKTWHGVKPPTWPAQPPAEPPAEPPTPPVPHSFQSAESPPDLAAAFAKIDELTARCDALIERNGRWTRYVTGGES
jgi:hypothetical protein